MHALAFRFSENKGRMYENIVFTELQRRNKDVYYWKSTKGNEVDFVIRKGRDIEEAIQVCYTLHDERTKQRELASLYAIEKELRPRKYTLICDDEEEEETIHRKKITIIPLWKWLLQGT